MYNYKSLQKEEIIVVFQQNLGLGQRREKLGVAVALFELQIFAYE